MGARNPIVVPEEFGLSDAGHEHFQTFDFLIGGHNV
jgi:hypothetical protein